MDDKPMVPLVFKRRSEEEMRRSSLAYLEASISRRSVRTFSSDPVPRDIIENCIKAAATSPSGANLQPWHFVAVSDPAVKAKIRAAGEQEERAFYERRASDAWKEVLRPFRTDANKPYLETAPWLIAIFTVNSYVKPDGEKQQTYYPKESVGIATGVLISALHQAGLATLTHTPSPMNFLNQLLQRPSAEKPFLLLIVGYPEEGTQVPAISRKSVAEIATFV